MQNTGRINHTVTPEVRDILYGKKTDYSNDPEMLIGTEVDLAHLVMLKESGLVQPSDAAKILSVIEDLRKNKFKELEGRDSSRGAYILYEDYLIEKLGIETAGNIQLARSRNDRNAAITKIRVRKLFALLVQELFNLQSSLLVSAKKFCETVMPIYTHYQAAQPIVLGHYLAGITSAFNRDTANLEFILDELEQSPLGAGAIAGTSINIDTNRTAELLGFTSGPVNSIDSIASRDYMLRILSCVSITGSTLSRFANDLLLWSTAEFNMITFPDELVGSSSMMPQKRNAFILENIQGYCTKALGGFVSAVTAQQSTPFSNSISVNAASVSSFWNAVNELIKSITLMRVMTEGIIPVKERMLQLTRDGFTVATAVTDRLTIQAGVPFREAHKTIGSMIKEIMDSPSREKTTLFLAKLKERYPQIKWEELEPETVAGNSEFGGGPGKASLEKCLSILDSKLNRQKDDFRDHENFWNLSEKKLDEVVKELIKTEK